MDNQLLRLTGEAGLKLHCELKHILTYRGTFLLLSSISARQLQANTDIEQTFERQKLKSAADVTVRCSFIGNFGSSSDLEEIIKLHLCQDGLL